MNNAGFHPCFPASERAQDAPSPAPFTHWRELTQGEAAQLQQYLDSFVRVNNHEPSDLQIDDFIQRMLALRPPGH